MMIQSNHTIEINVNGEFVFCAPKANLPELLYELQRGFTMKLTLEMIKEQWNRHFASTGPFLYQEKSPDQKKTAKKKPRPFYRSVRFLTGNPSGLNPETIYVLMDIPDNLQELTSSDGNDTAFIFTVPEESVSLYDTYYAFDQELSETGIAVGTDPLETFNRILMIFEIYDEYEKSLMNALNSDSPLQNLINLICEILGNPAYVVDRNYRALAMDQSQDLPFYSINWKRIREYGYLPYNVVSSITQNPEWDLLKYSEEPVLMKTKEFSTPFLAVNIWAEHKVQWRLFVCELLKKIRTADLDLVQSITDYLKHALLTDWKYRTLQENHHEPFLREIAAGTIQSTHFIAEQLTAFHWKLNSRYCLLEIILNEFDGYLRELVTSDLQKELHALSFMYNERFLLILSLNDSISYEKIAHTIENTMKHHPCFGILSNDFYGFHHLPVYVRQTERISVLLQSGKICIPEGKSCLDYRSCFINELQSILSEQIDPDSMMPAFLFRLKEYDHQHNSELFETLHQYLKWDRNLVKTANILHIHRNTLVYRMEQIHRIIGEPVENPDIRLLILLCMELQKKSG